MSGENIFQIFLLLIILAIVAIILVGMAIAYTKVSPVLDTASDITDKISSFAKEIEDKVNSVSGQLEQNIMDALKKAGISPDTIKLIGTVLPGVLQQMQQINTDVTAIYDKVVKNEAPKENFTSGQYYQSQGYEYVPYVYYGDGRTF
jgi:predicted PurR-regulated permease PerM